MALVGWWPLNDNLDNYSGDNIAIPINSPTKTILGKLGKSYVFPSSRFKVKTDFVRDSEFTITAWVKQTNNSGNQCIFNCRTQVGHGISIFLLNGVFRLDGGGLGGENYGFPLNQWTHIAYTKSLNRKSLYINGSHVYSEPCTALENLNGYSRFGSSVGNDDNIEDNYFVGEMNDLRIYNEVLSPEDIYEISRAKILHYKFNGDYEQPTINLFRDSNLGLNGNQIINNKIRIITKNTYDGISINSIGVEPNTNYTLSFKMQKVYGTLKKMRGHIDTSSFLSATIYVNGINLGNYKDSVNVEDTDEVLDIKVIFVGKQNTSTFSGNWIQPNGTISDPVDVDVWNIQIEKGEHATPHVTNTRNMLIGDSSGFRNNSITYQHISPNYVYKDSRKCIDVANGEGIQSVNFNSINSDECTLNAWVNLRDITVLGDRSTIFIQKQYLTIDRDRRVATYWYGKNPVGYYNSNTILDLNKWYMLTAVWSKDKHYIYINGILDKTINCSGVGDTAPNNVYIGREGGNRYFDGYISDVRLYATALKESDIIKIYNETK